MSDYSGEDQRVADMGPPAHRLNMRGMGPPPPDDDIAVVSRKALISIRTLSGAVLGLAGFATAVAVLLPFVPETAAHAQEAQAAVNKRIDDLQADTATKFNAVNEKVGAIQGTLSTVDRSVTRILRFNVQARVDELTRRARAAPNDAFAQQQLRAAQDELAELEQ